jgi:3-phosphoglycerate kinase
MDSKTILWNGPLGVFEKNFAHGTIALEILLQNQLQTEHSHWWEAEILWQQ